MSFATSVARLHAELKTMGLDLQDMRAERNLELTMVGPGSLDGETSQSARQPEIEWHEEIGIRAREIGKPRTVSRLTHFLDGTQRTLPGYFSTSVPIIASINAAAVLHRDEDRNCRVLPGMLALRHAWLAPLRSTNETVNRFVDAVQRQGGEIIDSLQEIRDPLSYAAALQDFGLMVHHAFAKGKQLRQDLEEQLLIKWVHQSADDDWIVVDGALRIANPRTVGLVKSFTRQYLTGDAAASLLRLPPRHRTAAFRVHDPWWRGAPVTAWYLRMHDAAGRDPRHALVRVEISADVRDSAHFDELSAWLLAERIPRATADERWATLLYPVHYLEQILKRYLEAETRGWPSPR